MVSKLNRLKRGFTLVELMIVVAIVGILAALAIYGVSKYVKNAKTAEARDALGRMSKDATSAFQREGMSASILALGGTASINHRLCSSASNAVPTAVPSAAKYQSSPSEWNTGDKTSGWTCLKFSMNDPQYFQYSYSSLGGEANNTTFDCVATGNLDGDAVNSTFTMSGQIATDGSGNKTAIYAPNVAEVNPDE